MAEYDNDAGLDCYAVGCAHGVRGDDHGVPGYDHGVPGHDNHVARHEHDHPGPDYDVDARNDN